MEHETPLTLKMSFDIHQGPPASGVPVLVGLWLQGFGWIRGGAGNGSIEVVATLDSITVDAVKDKDIKRFIKYINEVTK